MININSLNLMYYNWWKNIDKTIFLLIIFLFSPAGASFDNFKNFEDRGLYFNKLIKKFINAK